MPLLTLQAPMPLHTYQTRRRHRHFGRQRPHQRHRGRQRSSFIGSAERRLCRTSLPAAPLTDTTGFAVDPVE